LVATPEQEISKFGVSTSSQSIEIESFFVRS
jgi:hypothetical protein